MKKDYEAPEVEKIDFEYTDVVAASNGGGCNGGVYLQYTDGYTGCHEKSTENWINGYGNQ